MTVRLEVTGASPESWRERQVLIGNRNIRVYEILIVFDVCSPVCGNSRGRMYHNRASTNTSDYRSHTCSYHGNDRCNHGSPYGPALTGNWNFKGATVGGSMPVIPNVQVTLMFMDDGTLMGFGGCNNYNGDYTLTGQTTEFGKTISIGPLASTKKFCADTADFESKYLASLEQTKTYSITNNKMLLRGAGLNESFVRQGLRLLNHRNFFVSRFSPAETGRRGFIHCV